MKQKDIRYRLDKIFQSILNMTMFDKTEFKNLTTTQKYLVVEAIEYEFNIHLSLEDIRTMFSWNYAYMIRFIEKFLEPFE